MLADNTAHLVAAARRRSDATLERALAAISAAEQRATPVTLTGIAEAAGVSRAWLYTQPALQERIRPLLQGSPGVGRAVLPSSQRSSDASLRTRLELALRRNRKLAAENKQLQTDLQNALGQLRTGR